MNKKIRILTSIILIIIILFSMYINAYSIAITGTGIAITACAAALVAAGVEFATDEDARNAGWQMFNRMGADFQNAVSTISAVGTIAGQQMVMWADSLWNDTKQYVADTYDVGENEIFTDLGAFEYNGQVMNYILEGSNVTFNAMPKFWILEDGREYFLNLAKVGGTSTVNYYNLDWCVDGVYGGTLRTMSISKEIENAQVKMALIRSGDYVSIYYYYTHPNGIVQQPLGEPYANEMGLSDYQFLVSNASQVTSTAVANDTILSQDRDYVTSSDDRALALPSDFAGVTSAGVQANATTGELVGEGANVGSGEITTSWFNVSELNFEGLKNLVLIDKFPFCIPFDLIDTFRLFSQSAKEPSFVIDIDTDFLQVYHNIDLSKYTFYIGFFRYFVTFVFIIFLISKTRDLIKW